MLCQFANPFSFGRQCLRTFSDGAYYLVCLTEVEGSAGLVLSTSTDPLLITQRTLLITTSMSASGLPLTVTMPAK
jgi:hypothetical protein